MLFQRREEVISRSELDLTLASFPAQTKRVPIPRSTGPIEKIKIIVNFTLGSSITSGAFITGGFLNLLKRATLNINDGSGAYDAVSASGPSLIALQQLEGLTLDPATLAAIRVSNNNFAVTGSKFQITFTIDAAHPGLQEWLRVRSCIPCQSHVQDPVLTLDFAAATEVSSVADPFSAITCEILLVRLDLPNADFEALGGRAGFIRWDLRETLNDLPINTTSERRFAIPGPGEYASLAILMIKGANPNRYGDLSAVVTAGAETQFRLEAAGNALKTWRMKHRYLLNSENSAMLPMAMIAPVSEAVPISTAGASNGTAWVTAKNAAGAGNFGGPLETGLNIQNPAVVGFDFVGDNHGSVSELGGCLNANFPSDAIKWEIVGNILTPATYQSSFNLIGRRYRDNIEAYKRIKAA